MCEGQGDVDRAPEGPVAAETNALAAESRSPFMEPLELELVSHGLHFAGLRAEWDALLASSDAGIFNAWGWLYPWWQRIGADRALWILTARDPQQRLVGLLPLGLEVRSVAGLRVRRLAFLGETHVGSDYLDVVAPRGLEPTVARAFAYGLRCAMDEWDVLDLTDLREESPTLVALRETFEDEGISCTQRERYTCPFETFAVGETFDGFLRRTGRRDNYLRRRRWLEKQPGFRIETSESPGGLARAMAEFQWLHAARWETEGGSQGIKGPSVEAFHRDATQWLAEQGKVRLYTMRLGETPIASVYGLIHNGEFIYFQSGYDPAWRNKSVGLVLVGETFKDAIEQGLRGYDFLRGTEGYKSDWTHQERHTVSLRIHARSGPGAWFSRQEQWAGAGRRFAKRLLPLRAVESIRRRRRRRAAI